MGTSWSKEKVVGVGVVAVIGSALYLRNQKKGTNNGKGSEDGSSKDDIQQKNIIRPEQTGYLGKEEENFLRFYLLCQKIAPKSVRHYFCRLVPEPTLGNHLNNYKRILDPKGKHPARCTSEQWNILFPAANQVQLSKFDFSLLYKLFRNTVSGKEPTQGWGKKPSPNDIREEDDIERVREYRNYVAHNTELEISDTEFGSLWIDLNTVICRLDRSLKDDVQLLLNQKLSQDDKNIMINEIKLMKLEVDALRQDVEAQNQDIQTIKKQVDDQDTRLVAVENSISKNGDENFTTTDDDDLETDHAEVSVDGVILHAVEDTDMVKEFVNNMEKEFQHLKLKLRLFEELAIPGRGCFASTEKVFETCRYLFVFMTKNFEKAKMENFLHNILLRETIMEDEKNERLIPVQVDPEVEISILATTNPLKYNSYLARKGDESYCKIFKNIITHGRNNFLTM